MGQITPSQKYIFIMIGMVDLIIAIALLVVIFLGKTNLPVFIPILLIIPAVIIIAIGLRK